MRIKACASFGRSLSLYLLDSQILREISGSAFDSGAELGEDVERDRSQGDDHRKLDRHLTEQIPPRTHHLESLLSLSQVKRLVVVRRHGC